MIINPFTRQVLNANPKGDNQYVNPDGPSVKKKFIKVMKRGGFKVPSAPYDDDEFVEDSPVRLAHLRVGTKRLDAQRLGDVVKLDFEDDDLGETEQGKHLTKENLEFLRRLRDLAKSLHDEGFKIFSAPSDEKRARIYGKALTRLGMKPVGRLSEHVEAPKEIEGTVWNYRNY